MSSKEIVILKDVRLSFPDIWKPGRPPKDKPTEPGKYGGQFIFDKGSEAHQIVQAAMMRQAQAEFGPNWANVMRAMDKKNKAMRDGNDNLDKSGAIRDGYADKLFITARNKVRPMIVDRYLVNGQPKELTEADGRPYGGCYVNVKVEIVAGKAWEQVPNQVYAKLLSIQFIRDGEAFSGGPTNADGFDFDEEDGGGEAPTVGENVDELFS
jgi:hypothetical protein